MPSMALAVETLSLAMTNWPGEGRARLFHWMATRLGKWVKKLPSGVGRRESERM